MRAQRIGWIAMTVAVTGLMIGCSHSTTSPSTVASVTVSGPTPAIGSTAQLTATASLSDGTTQDVTNVATWESSEPTEAIVSSTGLVTAFAAGTVNITATYQSIMGTDAITIAP